MSFLISKIDKNKIISFCIFLFLLLLFYIFRGKILNSFITFSPDAALYLASGKLISQGLIPYLDYWDHKTPFIHYFSYFAYSLFDSSYFGGIFLSVSLMIFSILPILYLTLKNNFIIGISLCIIYFSLLYTNTDWVMMGESYCFIFSILSIFFLFQKKIPNNFLCFIGLFLLAISFSIKQLIVFDSMILAIHLLKYWNYWKSKFCNFFILSLLALTLSIFINIIPLLISGSFSSFIPCFIHNFGYAGGRLGFNLNSLDLSHSLPLFGCCIVCIICLLKSLKCRINFLIGVINLIWLCGSWYMSSGTHQHYMITLWQPFIFSIYFLSILFKSKISIKLDYRFLFPFLIFFPKVPILASKFKEMTIKPEYISFIEENTPSSDSYFCFSNHNGGILLHLNRLPSSKYCYLAPIAHSGGDKHLKEIVKSLEFNLPKILIINELDDSIKDIKNFQFLHQYLTKMSEVNYVQLKHYSGLGKVFLLRNIPIINP